MAEVAETVAAALREHGAWAGPLVFGFAFAESLAVVGAFIPATPVLFLLGTLLGAGKLGPEVALWALAGAIAGYWLSWAIGLRFGRGLLRLPALRRQRRALARLRWFFRRWGGPALVLGRFVLGPFQSNLPLVAGIAGFPARRFHRWNVLSGLIWVIAVLTPGFVVGRGLVAGAASEAVIGQVLFAASMASLGGLVVVAGVGAWRSRRPR